MSTTAQPAPWGICPQCSAALPQPRASGSPRRFCSATCRNKWHKLRLRALRAGLVEDRRVRGEEMYAGAVTTRLGPADVQE